MKTVALLSGCLIVGCTGSSGSLPTFTLDPKTCQGSVIQLGAGTASHCYVCPLGNVATDLTHVYCATAREGPTCPPGFQFATEDDHSWCFDLTSVVEVW